MHPLNYMRLHDQSSGNPRQYWTNVSNGKIRLLRWVAHGQLLRLYIWSFLVSILAKIAPFLPSKNQISDLPSKMSEPCEKGSGYLIILCDCSHFPVDTLMQPSEHDDMDPGLGV